MYNSVFFVYLLFSFVFFFPSIRRHTSCALVTGVQTCALPIYVDRATLYGPGGVVSYSTEQGLIGKRTADSDAARAAVSGELIKTVIGPERAAGQERTVLKQLVPISFGDSAAGPDRKSAEGGKRLRVRVDLGGRGMLTNK